jgi:thymidylate kinase
VNATTNPPPTIALCGLDGVGKSSLFEALHRHYRASGVAFIGRGPADAEQLIERSFPRSFTDVRDWQEGEFFDAMSIACAMDYAVYHHAALAPLLDASCVRLLGRAPRAIITDRHALCFIAYAASGEVPQRTALRLLETIPAPDLVVYVEAPPLLIAERRRDGKVHEFDHPDVQRSLARGYEWALRRYSGKLLRLENSGTFTASLSQLVAHIDSFLLDHQVET